MPRCSMNVAAEAIRGLTPGQLVQAIDALNHEYRSQGRPYSIQPQDQGYVLTLRNTSVLFAAVMAFTIGERPAHAELAGAALVAGGAVLMAW